MQALDGVQRGVQRGVEGVMDPQSHIIIGNEYARKIPYQSDHGKQTSTSSSSSIPSSLSGSDARWETSALVELQLKAITRLPLEAKTESSEEQGENESTLSKDNSGNTVVGIDQRVTMNQEGIVALLQQTVRLSMEVMNDRFANLATHFSRTVHAGQAAIQNTTLTTGISLISIGKFSNEGDTDTYLNTFECATIQNQWDKLTWAVRLRGLSTGKAAEAISMLPPNQISYYNEVKREVLLSLGVTSEVYRVRFRSEQKEADQSFIDYGRRLERLSIKWFECQDYKTETDPETLRQK
ncbi:hypothetical protein QYM36_005683 [Artemia franciscana]|uniref:Gag protein n=1 Tax=Artemia franciscana TaxID=6661 RepID=A0AA88I1S7_ARTSF|nr:hypothetical protein QYM36_005683 [Artemia franciscana]